MCYVCILLSLKDGKFCVGYMCNLEKRIEQHKKGKVESTKGELSIKLICYEGYFRKEDVEGNEIRSITKQQKEEVI